MLDALLNNLGKYDGSSYLNLLEEYIDNAFDAQANSVTIVFDSKRQKITIIDAILLKNKGKGLPIL